MHRFFIPPEWIKDSGVSLTGAFVHQLRNVLRFRPGDSFIVLDNSGWEYQVELLSLGLDNAQGRIIQKSQSQGEPKTTITLYQALLKTSKLEFVLQKGTELGVTRFVPVLCQRSVARGLTEPEASKVKRWRDVIREAAEQSGRCRLPALDPPVSFSDACRQAEGLALMPWEGEERLRISDAIAGRKIDVMSIFIGPEGGFSVEEVEEARSHGILPVTLGKRILRAETAAVVAVTAVLCRLGEI